MAVLALAAGLLYVAVVALGAAPDRFAIGDLGPSDVGRDLELPDHSVYENVQVQFAHARDASLPALLVGVDTERGIFLG